jgi:histidyl-tRNA synthetase
VPLKRVYLENLSEFSRTVFKRYQIQPVWRADKPGRGRFREFYQCDIDTVGSTSPIVEAEQITAVSEILTKLGFREFVVRLNHRGVLTGMLEASGIPASLHNEALVALDKRDKIGADRVELELVQRGIDSTSAIRLLALTSFLPSALDPEDEIAALRAEIGHIPVANEALDNLQDIVRLSAPVSITLDKSLARGLSYYTGAIMEITVRDLPGSLGGGGRYDNLIGIPTTSKVPGALAIRTVPACGFSLGLERILVVMEERDMFPSSVEQSSVDVVVAALEAAAQQAAMNIAKQLRTSHLRVDLYPDVARKMDRVFRHVDQRRAKFVAIIGSDELASDTVTIRNVATRTKQTVATQDAGAFIVRALSD